MGRFKRAARFTAIGLLSALPLLGAQQALSANEVACEKSRYEFCANGLYARAPNSARTTSAMCLPGDQAGTPEIFALLNQNGSTPETILETEIADPLKRDVNPATALTSTLNFGRNAAESDPFVPASSERALYLTSTLLGPNPLDLASNVTNGVSGATLGNAALSTLRTTCTTKYGAEDFTVRDAFKDTLRFVACDGGACAGDGDYLTSPAIWRDQQTSNWGYTFNVRDAGGGLAGKVNGTFTVPVDASGKLQEGSAAITDHTLPNGIVGRTYICMESPSGNTLDDCIVLSTNDLRYATVDWSALGATGDPSPPWDTWITSPSLPGYSVQTRINNSVPVEGRGEDDCIKETICVSGALPGRPEMFVKLIGFPDGRPNGYLWAQVSRFTPSPFELWLRKDATGEINHYVLGPASGDNLPGLQDREAFLP